MEKLKHLFVISLLLLVLPAPFFTSMSLGAEGDRVWINPAATPREEQNHVRIISDGNGGAILVWQDNRNEHWGDDNWDIYAQRIDASGNAVWGSNGIAIAAGDEDEVLPELAPDGSGGAIIAWKRGSSIFVQRIDSSGSILWTPGGVEVANNSSVDSLNPIAIDSEGRGGAFIAFRTALGIRCARVESDGSLASPGINGIDLGAGAVMYGGPALAAVKSSLPGSKSAFVVMCDGFCARVQKVSTDFFSGNLVLPWGTPKNLSCDPRREARPDIALDGDGGAFITWARQRDPVGDPAGNHVVAQHIDSDGNALWAANGLILVDSSIVGGNDECWRSYEVIPSIAADGLGGAVVAWNDWRNQSTWPGGNDDIYVQRIDHNGSPVWTAGGISAWYYPGGSQRRPKVVTDGAGRSLVVFQDMGMGNWDIIGVKLDRDGSRWSAYKSYIYYDGMDGEDQINPVVAFNGSGPSPTGAIVAWVDKRDDEGDIYATKIELIYPKPDLVIASINFDPVIPDPNQPFGVTIRVRNEGPAPTNRGFYVGLDGLQDGLFMDSCYINDNLSQWEEAECTVTYDNGKPFGSYIVTAYADGHASAMYNDLIDESVENNNSRSTTLRVTEKKADFDCDQDVDGKDLQEFIDNYYVICNVNEYCPWDLDGSRRVDGDDLAILAGEFGL